MRRRTVYALVLLALAVGQALGDGIILADGRKLSGRVVEKPDGYEITIEGQTSGYSRDQIKRIVKAPREVLGDADRNVEDAKKIYSEAVTMADEKAADLKFREALPKVQKAREAYVDARELFPEGYPELDEQLVNIMKLMRLVRERIHSAKADAAAPPVKAKTALPPRLGGKPFNPDPVPKPSSDPTPARQSKPEPKPELDVKPEPEPKPEPDPNAPPPPDGTPEELPRIVVMPTITLKEAIAVLVDPALRAEKAKRADAKVAFRKFMEADAPSADVATAGWLLLSKTDADWGLVADVVTVRTTSAPAPYRGQLEKRSDGLSILVLADRREVRIRTAKDGTYVTTPGGVELKAAEVKVASDQPSEAFDALQAFFKGVGPDALESLEGKGVSEGVQFLGLKVRELRTKNVSAEAPALFVAGVASALIHKQKGKPTVDLEVAFKDLGFEKSEFGAVWGRKESLAMDDYRKWIGSGEYNMAVIQFFQDYRSVTDATVQYATGLLYLFRALGQNRDYYKAAAYLEQSSQAQSQQTVKDHFAALAKSIRDLSPCNVCGGTHKLNCNVCKGKIKINLQCNVCGGSGRVNQLRGGVVTCQSCNGVGRFNNVDCPKCKATGTIECKGRGCVKAVVKPTFESFADAYTCPSCQGHGSLMRHVAYTCSDCGGIGLILQAKADPTKLFR